MRSYQLGRRLFRADADAAHVPASAVQNQAAKPRIDRIWIFLVLRYLRPRLFVFFRDVAAPNHYIDGK
jgi:hypothetical protein